MGVKNWKDAKIAAMIREKNKKNLLIAAEHVRSMAALLCTVGETGNLRGGYDKESVNDERARVYNSVEYAPFVELGTSKMAAQPSLRPALHGSTRAVKKILDLQR